jgi:hypothetical protein
MLFLPPHGGIDIGKPSMKLLLVSALLAATLASAPAHARKDCEELKREIAANIDAKGVKAYTLDILASADESAATTVGSCNGGTQKIVYQRGATAPVVAASETAKPAN